MTALQQRGSLKKPIFYLFKAILGDVVIPLADEAPGFLDSYPLALKVSDERSIFLLVGHQVWML